MEKKKIEKLRKLALGSDFTGWAENERRQAINLLKKEGVGLQEETLFESLLKKKPNWEGKRYLALKLKTEDLEGIGYFKTLIYLNLSGSLLYNLKPLKKLKFLSFLDISDTNVTDVRDLKSLPRLKGLNLNNLHLRSLTPLINLKLLKFLRLKGTKFTVSQKENLKFLRQKGVKILFI